MMRRRAAGLLLAAGVLAAGSSAAGTVTPELEAHAAARPATEYVDVIVRFASRVDLGAHAAGPLAARREALVRALRARADAVQLPALARISRHGPRDVRRIWLINAIALRVPAGSIAALAALDGVESVAQDAVIELAAPGPEAPAAASAAPSEWNLAAIQAPAVWQLGFDGTGTVVALLDSGVDPAHPDLGPRWRGGANSWFDPYGQHATPYDASGHGTGAMGLAVGGDAGGSSIGVAPGARWIAAKIFRDNGQATLSGIHASFQWVLDPDGDPASNDAPDVALNPWFLEASVGSCDAEFAIDVAALDTAGIAVVFAAGNSGPGSGTSVSPANDPRSIAAGATDVYTIVAGFSSRGPSACDGGLYPALVAPGVDVRTADLTLGGVFPDSYINLTGTSFAAAHLAGGVALLRDAFPAASVAQIRSALAVAADDLSPPGPDPAAGAGLLDLPGAYVWLLAQGSGPGDLSFRQTSYAGAENGGAVAIAVQRVGGTQGAVSVDYATADGSAAAGSDYASASGTLTFADGEDLRTFSVSVLDDAAYEGDETVLLALSNPTGGASLVAPMAATLTIAENEPPPPPDIDMDGFPMGVDCDDFVATSYPGAPEVVRDGVDQDCNGYDLTIAIIRAPYSVRLDKLEVVATSDFGPSANLSVRVEVASAATFTVALVWNSKLSVWQRMIDAPEQTYGSEPVSVEVFGPEGTVFGPVLRR